MEMNEAHKALKAILFSHHFGGEFILNNEENSVKATESPEVSYAWFHLSSGVGEKRVGREACCFWARNNDGITHRENTSERLNFAWKSLSWILPHLLMTSGDINHDDNRAKPSLGRESSVTRLGRWLHESRAHCATTRNWVQVPRPRVEAMYGSRFYNPSIQNWGTEWPKWQTLVQYKTLPQKKKNGGNHLRRQPI